jgi:hypothetical protein
MITFRVDVENVPEVRRLADKFVGWFEETDRDDENAWFQITEYTEGNERIIEMSLDAVIRVYGFTVH